MVKTIMKTKALINILLVGLILFGQSCKDDFLEEKGYQTDYTYYNTADGLNALIMACYQNTRWAATSENLFKLEDMGTDLYMVGGDGGNREAFCQFRTDYLTPGEGAIGGMWSNNYKCIYGCNLALEYMATNKDMAADIKTIREGETRFLRAYYYYMLVVQFGNVPLVLKTSSSPKSDYLRAPQADVWRQIISDLQIAWNNLPWADASGKITGDYGRVGKGAAGHLLAMAYMFRYCGLKYATTQSDANMVEDRGGKETDLDSVIYYASRVCNYGEGAGSGSTHALATNYADLWGWDSKNGSKTDNYTGPEVLFSINFSKNPFYNNVAADNYDGGNILHVIYTGQVEKVPLVTNYNGTSYTHGSQIGLGRDKISGRPWKRLAPTYYYFADDGLYGARNYESHKMGKLIDSRLYKSHNWVWFNNNVAGTADYKWKKYSNAAGSFDPASIGKTAGSQKYGLGDTCVVMSLENVENRFATGTQVEKLILAREQEKYWYYPLNSSILKAADFQAASDYNSGRYTNHAFPSSAKWLDSRRNSANNTGGIKNVMRFRLGETWILLSEAYARKANFPDAAACLNKVRERAAWHEGETKSFHFWKYDGGDYADRTKSTVSDMTVTPEFIQSFTGDALTAFYLDENGHETAGEMSRFDLLVRYGADYWYKRVTTYNEWVLPAKGGNIQLYHRFRPVPTAHIDAVYPKDPNGQNYGY
jgi:hypothetical protein